MDKVPGHTVESLGVNAPVAKHLAGVVENPGAPIFELQPLRTHMATESEVITIIKTICQHKGIADANVEASSRLYEDGIGLDSLSVAELSASLEKAFGSDPYSKGQLPQTVSDIVNFYAAN